jgi:hypothetical protein
MRRWRPLESTSRVGRYCRPELMLFNILDSRSERLIFGERPVGHRKRSEHGSIQAITGRSSYIRSLKR